MSENVFHIGKSDKGDGMNEISGGLMLQLRATRLE